MHLRLNDVRVVQRSRLETDDLGFFRVLMVNPVATGRAEIAARDVATSCWTIKDSQVATQNFKIFAFHQHGHTEGTGRDFLTISAMTYNSNEGSSINTIV